MRLTKFHYLVVFPQNILFLISLVLFFYLNLSFWWILVIYINWVFLGVVGFSTFYHKYYAHRAFELKPRLRFLRYIFSFLGMLTGQGSVLAYSALHRAYHHGHTDRDKFDFHSPKVYNFWHAYYGWYFSELPPLKLTSVKDLLKDSWLCWSHRNYEYIYVTCLVLIGVINWKFLLYGIIVPSSIHVHEMNILNSLCHSKRFGYRNFDIPDDSVNNFIFGVLTWGTGFHNNHHARPSAWHNRVHWFEIDPFYWILPLIMVKNETENS